MALVTLCPDCGTAFRVNAIQLQAHSGDVRCGQCQRIFNGFATLITVNESAIEYPSELQPQPGTELEILLEATESIESLRDVTDQLVTDRIPITTESPDRLFDDEKSIQESWKGWAVANVLVLLLLIGQIAYSYRTQLTIVVPEIRPHLEQFCTLMDCTVPYPQDIKQLSIETSDLQKNLSRQPEVTTVSAVIRNYAIFPQALPALQLSLLDAHDQVIVSRIFTAQNYLLEEDKKMQFIEPQQDIEIRLDFDSSNLNALGYRLHLIYL